MRRLLAALVIGVAGTSGGAQAATAPADPIVGTWSYGGGTVSVRQTGSTFEGIVGSPIRFTQCLHDRGERMWTIVRTPRGYAGRQFSFGAGIGCSSRIWVSANWKLERGALRFWVAERSSVWPQRCGGETLCCSLARRSGAKPPQAVAQGSFRFALRGVPVSAAGLGESYDSTVAGGQGTLTAAGVAKGAARVFHVQSTGPGELTELELAGPSMRTDSTLVLPLAVRSSTVEGCAAGDSGTLTLVNGPVDEAVIRVCGRTSRYRDGGGNNVRVSFTRP